MKFILRYIEGIHDLFYGAPSLKMRFQRGEITFEEWVALAEKESISSQPLK